MKAGVDTKRRLIETARDLIWKSSYGAVSVEYAVKAMLRNNHPVDLRNDRGVRRFLGGWRLAWHKAC